eukprot:128236-Chlamydomonas_euryale.AAC.1
MQRHTHKICTSSRGIPPPSCRMSASRPASPRSPRKVENASSVGRKMVALPKLNSSWGICSARVWNVGCEAPSERKHTAIQATSNLTRRGEVLARLWVGWRGMG